MKNLTSLKIPALLGAIALAVAGCGTVAIHTPGALAEKLPFLAKDKAEAMVVAAVENHRENGAQKTIRRVQDSGDFIDGEFYVFVIDADTYEVVANPAFPDVVGKKLTELKAPDGGGLQHLADDATAAGDWVKWHWFNPETGKPQDKIGWMVRVDNYVYGCGIYI